MGNAGVIAPSCPCCSRTAPLCAFQVATVTTTALFSEPEIAGASALALRTPKQTGRCTAAQAWRAPWMPQRLLLRRRMRCGCCPQAVLQEQIILSSFTRGLEHNAESEAGQGVSASRCVRTGMRPRVDIRCADAVLTGHAGCSRAKTTGVSVMRPLRQPESGRGPVPAGGGVALQFRRPKET